MLPAHFKNHQGFALIEIIIATVILALITGLATPYLFGSREKTSLQTEADKLVAVLKIAQQKAIAAYKGYDYTITFDTTNHQYTLSPDGEITKLTQNHTIENALPNSITFSRLTGRPQQEIEVYLASPRFHIQILVNQEGLITAGLPEKK